MPNSKETLTAKETRRSAVLLKELWKVPEDQREHTADILLAMVHGMRLQARIDARPNA